MNKQPPVQLINVQQRPFFQGERYNLINEFTNCYEVKDDNGTTKYEKKYNFIKCEDERC